MVGWHELVIDALREFVSRPFFLSTQSREIEPMNKVPKEGCLVIIGHSCPQLRVELHKSDLCKAHFFLPSVFDC